MDFLHFILASFSTDYDEVTQVHTFSWASIIATHAVTATFGLVALRSAMSASFQSKKLGNKRFSIFSSSLLNETRSTLPSSLIMFISYILSSLGMHVFSIFNTGEPSGRELYLSYVVMDSLTLMAILFAHIYMRVRYSFSSEMICRLMVVSSALNLMIYITSFYPPISYNMSWDALDAVALIYIIGSNTASITCCLAISFPKTAQSLFRKLANIIKFTSKETTVMCNRFISKLKKKSEAI